MDFELIIAVVGVLFGAVQTYQAFKANKTVATEKSKNENLKRLFGNDDQLLTNVGAVLKKIEETLIEEASTGRIEVKNLGLDLETVVPWLGREVGPNIMGSKLKNVQLEYKALIVNPQSPMINRMIDGDSDISTATVTSRLEEIKRMAKQNLPNTKIEIRSYDLPPVIHGFVINNKHLFISFTEVSNEKLKGGTFPYCYMEFDHTSDLNRHYFNMYRTWFDYMWDSSKPAYQKN
ncbi:MAG TPA: hypothetical protein VFE50_15620 [Cyclobacteriaceae bacterium]|nr:hypothetical protein [Cyclobacteriaceae bacterium]